MPDEARPSGLLQRPDERLHLGDLHEHAAANTQFALGAARQAWEQSCLGNSASLDPRRVGIYLGAGEGVLDFDTYARVGLQTWNPESGTVDAPRWAGVAHQAMDRWGEIGQEPNMPASPAIRWSS